MTPEQPTAAVDAESAQEPKTAGNDPTSVPMGLQARRNRSDRQRDRIVILGRTQAGKTVYLSTLYYMLWRHPKEIRVRSLSGGTHKACIEAMETLRQGRWPSSTTGSKYLELEIDYRGYNRPLVSLDYPGEVFRKAFVDNAQTPDVEELLEHVDHAVAVIALIDPAVAASRSLTKAMDDDFGMLKAIERIRAWPGGERVPIALVLTKYDQRRGLVDSEGGPKEFVKNRFAALARLVPELAVFTCSIAHEVRNSSDQSKLHVSPTGLVAPLQFVLDALNESDVAKADGDAARRRRASAEAAARAEIAGKRRAIRFWTLGWIWFLLTMALVGFVAWRLTQP